MNAIQAIQDQEESIRSRVRDLADDKRREFFRRSEQQLKDPDTYATLNYLFVAGLHHFYLGKWLQGLVNVLVFCSGIILFLAGFTLSGIGIVLAISLFELYALFNAQAIVAEYNNEVMEQIYNDITRAVDS
jgi:hypothetical protein